MNILRGHAELEHSHSAEQELDGDCVQREAKDWRRVAASRLGRGRWICNFVVCVYQGGRGAGWAHEKVDSRGPRAPRRVGGGAGRGAGRRPPRPAVFTAHLLWAFALSQTRRQKNMSIAGEALRWAFNRRAGLTAIVFSLLIYEIVKGIVQEFEEYTTTAATESLRGRRPLWNLFEGGGSEVLVLFQTLGAALEAAAYRDAEADAPRNAAAAARIGWRAADLRHAPLLAWLVLEASWDVIMVREYFDEDDEAKRGLNPNRVRARMCALAGVVKTIGDLIDCYFGD